MSQQPNNAGNVPAKPLASGGRLAAMVPTNSTELMNLSQMLSTSTLVPQAYQGKPGDVAVCLMHGMEVGFTPTRALSTIAVINGRATIWGDGLPGLVYGQNKGHKIEDEKILDGDGKHVGWSVTVTRGDTGTKTTREFTLDDAKLANLLGKKGPWSQYPLRMCFHRARSWAVRDGVPEALMGLGLAEEVEDIPMRDITPAQPAAAALYGS